MDSSLISIETNRSFSNLDPSPARYFDRWFTAAHFVFVAPCSNPKLSNVRFVNSPAVVKDQTSMRPSSCLSCFKTLAVDLQRSSTPSNSSDFSASGCLQDPFVFIVWTRLPVYCSFLKGRLFRQTGSFKAVDLRWLPIGWRWFGR